MAESRYFRNDMPEFVAETEEAVPGDSILKLLAMPYIKTKERFLRAALNLKETIVKKTMKSTGRRVKDYTLYTGALGTAFLLFKSYQITKNKNDLELCVDIVGACESASRGSDLVTFICGRAGVCALGAVVAKHSGDQKLQDHYLRLFKEIQMPYGVPNELLYGRAGYLWACSFLNKHIGDETATSKHMGAIVKDMLKEGKLLAKDGNCPLMYEWHGKRYWGAAHGLAGIMHVLMDAKLKPEEQDRVQGTLCYMIQSRFPSGNYPSSEGSEQDRLVHWCHGAPGVALTLTKAAQVFKDEGYQKAAIEAGEVVWNGGLLKRVGICHGISGNAYVFLSLYRLTGEVKYLYRAKAFACFLLDKAESLISKGVMHGGDDPYSLFEGLGGMAYLFFDMADPLEARFPAYEL
ncbi:lanC-like protein GCR2 [Aristolochia californica]|uniref:lanC-like protein GCR2 n=1 Tax=Aristolochia californica TaxID=171875 RepID=UPI0035DFDFF6